MRNFIRFLFSGNDVGKIITPLQIEDVFPVAVAAPPAGSPAPGSMKLRFRQNDPGPAQIRPLFPGSMRFIVDSSVAGVLPGATAVEFTSAAYAGWKTLGRLLITVEDKHISDELLAIAPGLPVKPNKIWYGPVRIPEGFLFNTLRTNLKKANFRTANGRTIRPKNPDGTDNLEWAKNAVAEFLVGRYSPVLRLGADATQDDGIRFAMPTVEVPAAGDIELFVTTALAQKPQDGPDSEQSWFASHPAQPNPASPISGDEPLHPRNGLIPAREVYRQLRPHMVGEAPSEPLRNAILADWPNAPRFFAIPFTRTSERIPNCSAHFTRHTVRIQEGANVLMEQQLPSHGVLFLPQAPATPEPAPFNVKISLVNGDMKWLLGGGTTWREKGQTMPVAINLGTTAQPHIAVRLPMIKAMFSDSRKPKPGGASCTYLSLRRTVRALVDNRIAGGRLNFGVNSTSAETRGIITRAFTGTGATANLVAHNAPDPYGAPNLALTLKPILIAFFPSEPPQSSMTQGEVGYLLWQTITESFESNTTRSYFSQDHIGGGGAGAIVALKLGRFHSGVGTVVINTDAALDQRVESMLTGLMPGAALQFWDQAQDFLDIQQRNAPLKPPGHSPIFVGYEGPANAPTGIVIIDQFGETVCPVTGVVGHRRIDWNFEPRPWVAGTGWLPEVWIAANWEE